MKKINYIWLISGIVVLTLWVFDLISLINWEKVDWIEVWFWIRGIYVFFGFFFGLLFLCEACPELEESKDSKLICDRCGNTIKIGEKSLALHHEDKRRDYCEKCKGTVKIIS